MYYELIFGAVLIFVVIQLYYYLYYFSGITFHKENFDVKDHKPVSVIVCAHNELENLQRLIPAILEQNYHLFELVIVNDRSFDGSYDYLEALRKQHPRLKIVTVDESKSGMDYKKYALTLGIKAAAHEYILLTDADCMPANKNWILHMQSRFIEGTEFVLGVSQYEQRPGFLNAIIRLETLYTAMQYLSFAIRGNPYMGVGRNLSYKKSVFLDNKGFHPHMYTVGGDDDLFVNRLAAKSNTKVSLQYESQTVSIAKTTWTEWIRQKKRHLSVSRYYSTNKKIALFLFNFSHLGVYLSFILLTFSVEFFYYGLLAFLFRWLVLITIFNTTSKKLRFNIPLGLTILFDLAYPFYYIVVGLQALRVKNVRWK